LSWSLVSLLFITEFFLYHKFILFCLCVGLLKSCNLFQNSSSLHDETTTQSNGSTITNHSSTTTIHFGATITDEGNSQI